MDKNKIIALIVLIGILGGIMLFYKSDGPLLGDYSNAPTPRTASTTVFTLTTTSQQLLSTSSLRVAATIGATGCTSLISNVYVRMSSGAAATVSTGLPVFSTTTLAMGSYPSPNIVPQDAVTGITNTGTCTVLVTEWLR